MSTFSIWIIGFSIELLFSPDVLSLYWPIPAIWNISRCQWKKCCHGDVGWWRIPTDFHWSCWSFRKFLLKRFRVPFTCFVESVLVISISFQTIESLCKGGKPCAILVVYSITQPESFLTATLLMCQLHQRKYMEDWVVMLVGNKSDLVRSRAIEFESKYVIALQSHR